MKRSLIIYSLLMILCYNLQAQDEDKRTRNKRHDFLLNFDTRYFLNEGDVKTISGTKDWMNVKNNYGFEVGLAYEYENKKHITYTTTIGYGIQKHYLNWDYNIREFLPSRFEVEAPIYNRFETYVARYLSTSFLLGYNYHLPQNNRLTIQGKAGAGFVAFFKHINQAYNNYLGVYNDAGDTLFVEKISTEDRELGTGEFGNFKDILPTFHDDAITLHLYVGLSYELPKLKLLRRMDVGIKYMQTPKGMFSAGTVMTDYYRFEDGEQDARQVYTNKMRSFAITVGFGF